MSLSNLLSDFEKIKKLARVFLVIAILLPSLTYPLTKLTNDATLMRVAFAMKGVEYKPSFDEYELVIVNGKWVKEEGYNKGRYEYRLAIPFNYIIVISILLFSSGIFLLYKFRENTTHNKAI